MRGRDCAWALGRRVQQRTQKLLSSPFEDRRSMPRHSLVAAPLLKVPLLKVA